MSSFFCIQSKKEELWEHQNFTGSVQGLALTWTVPTSTVVYLDGRRALEELVPIDHWLCQLVTGSNAVQFSNRKSCIFNAQTGPWEVLIFAQDHIPPIPESRGTWDGHLSYHGSWRTAARWVSHTRRFVTPKTVHWEAVLENKK